jgi:hypothetical protein
MPKQTILYIMSILGTFWILRRLLLMWHFLDGVDGWVHDGVGVGLFGQNGFFDEFRVCLHFNKKSFDILGRLIAKDFSN